MLGQKGQWSRPLVREPRSSVLTSDWRRLIPIAEAAGGRHVAGLSAAGQMQSDICEPVCSILLFGVNNETPAAGVIGNLVSLPRAKNGKEPSVLLFLDRDDVAAQSSAARITEPEATAMDVGAWLRELGLEQYEAAFRAHAVDAEILPTLTDRQMAWPLARTCCHSVVWRSPPAGADDGRSGRRPSP